MSVKKHLTFANIAAGTALAVALAGGGAAVAAGLAKNSVGSEQVKPNSLTSADIKDSSLKGVKSAKKADTAKTATSAASAKTVDTVATRTVTVAPGQTKTIYAKGTFVVELTCTDNGSNNLRADVDIRTTADNALMDANDYGDEESDFDVTSGPAEIVSTSSSADQDIEDGGFAALSASGQALTGHAFAVARPAGAATCLGGGSFVS